MGVVGRTRTPPPHSGVVVFAFRDDEGKVVRSNRVFTRKDAALVYDALRRKYPELDDLKLSVSVKPEHLVTPDERRSAVARKTGDEPVEHVPGEAFVESLEWRGPRPRATGRGVLLEAVGEGVDERLGQALAILSAPAPWRRAEGGWPR